MAEDGARRRAELASSFWRNTLARAPF